MSELVVSVRGLTKRYGSIVAVDGLNLEVGRGAIFGLLGPNGAGKSTTFGILCGWLKADAGQASILGNAVVAPHRLRGRLAALPQDAAFPKQISVLQQLCHFGALSGVPRSRLAEEARRVLDLVGLPDVANRRGGELSHGMLKRVGLAQALLGAPEVIFLDEPTAGLDPASARQVKDLVHSLAPQATVVISSHNLAEIQEICSHAAILDHGRLVKAGTIAELTRQASEITVELGPLAGRALPLAELAALPGAAEVKQVAANALRLRCSEADVTSVIARTLRLLLDRDIPILGLRRGTSLETAFLDATQRPAGDGVAAVAAQAATTTAAVSATAPAPR